MRVRADLAMVVAVVLMSAASGWSQAAEAKEFRDVTYYSPGGKDLKLDIYENAAATAEHPAPVLLTYHGGGWVKGERLDHNGFKSFMKDGFTVLSVDYRLASEGNAPAAVTDVLCSIAWVAKNAAQYHFDAKRIVLQGGSAGAHLALLGGMLPRSTDIADPQCGPLPKVAAVLDFFGRADLVPGMGAGKFYKKDLVTWIGPATDPIGMAKKLSPMTYVRAGVPPIFIAHGDADPTVPYQLSVEFQKALDAAGVPNDFYTVKGGKHGQWPDEEKKIADDRARAFLRAQGITP